MYTCLTDPNLERKTIKGFKFPLGVYPVEPMTPIVGYSSDFEPADNEEEMGEWEAWPDQYVFDIVMPSDRVEAFWHQVFAMMPGRVFPIIDYIGHDAYREIDPYMAYEPIGKEKIIDGVRQFRPFFFEDGMVGFGAVSEDPFIYIFIDEHKIITVRVDAQYKLRIEQLLEAFEIEVCPEPAGADSASHEHRSTLITASDRTDLLVGDQILERMRDSWRLVLNVDPDTNVDDEGNELGTTPWRCLARYATDQTPDEQYIELFLAASSIRQAEELVQQCIGNMLEGKSEWLDIVVMTTDRMSESQFKALSKETKDFKPFDYNDLTDNTIIAMRPVSGA